MKKTSPFRFGCINEQMKPAKEWREHVRKIEALGYDILLMRDHFVPDVFGDTFGPIAALMSAADTTSTLRVGSMVICNDFRHPAVLAKEAATMDWLSEGRFELGLGAGWMRDEYDRMGLELDQPSVRIRRLEESLLVLQGLMDAGDFSFQGEHYAVRNLDGFPKPVQRHIPIMIGGGNRKILNLAGKKADIAGILVTNVSNGIVVNDPLGRSSEAVQQKLEWVKEGAGDRFDEIELNSAVDIVVTDNRRSATEEFIVQHGWQGISVEQVWDMPSIFIGSSEYIVEEMFSRREKFGFSYYWVPDKKMEEFAPLIQVMRGK